MEYQDLRNHFVNTTAYSDNPEYAAAYKEYLDASSAAEKRRIVADFFYNPTGENKNIPKGEEKVYQQSVDKLYDDIDALNKDKLEDRAQLAKDAMKHSNWKDYQLDSASRAGGLNPEANAIYTQPFQTSLGNASLQKRMNTRATSASESMSPGNSILAGATRAGSWLGLPGATQVDRMNQEGLNASDLSGGGAAKLVGQGILDAALWMPKKAYDTVAGVVTKAVPKIPEAVKAGTNLLLDFSGPVKQGLGAGLSTAMNEPTEGTQWWTNSAIPDVLVGGTAGVGLGAGSFLLKKGNMGVGKMAKAAKKELGKSNDENTSLAARENEFNARTEAHLPEERKSVAESASDEYYGPAINFSKPLTYSAVDFSPENIIAQTLTSHPDIVIKNERSVNKGVTYARKLADANYIKGLGDVIMGDVSPILQKSAEYKQALAKQEQTAQAAAEAKSKAEMEAKYGKNWYKKSKIESLVDAFMNPTKTAANAITSPRGRYATTRLAPRVSIPDQQKGEPNYESWDMLPGNYTYKFPIAASQVPVIGRTLVPYEDPKETKKRQMKYSLPQWMLND